MFRAVFHSIRWLACLCIVVVAVAVEAQQTTPIVTSTLQSSLLALSGSMTVQDITLSGTATAGSESGTVELKATAVGQSRIDLNLSAGARSELRSTSDSGPAGVWYGADQMPHTIAPHNLFVEPAWFVPSIVISRLLSLPSSSVSYLGQETKGGSALLHFRVYQQLPGVSNPLAVTPQHLSQMELYLDPVTLLPTVLSFNAHPDSDASVDISTEIYFSNYQNVSGVLVPHSIQKHVNNGLVLDMEIQSVQLNCGIPAQTFTAQ